MQPLDIAPGMAHARLRFAPGERLPLREDCVLSAMLDKRAAELGDKTCVLFDPDGESWTYAETRHRAMTTATALARLGVKRGDTVLAWLPNGKEIFSLHLGLAYLGAVFVPVNLAYRGSTLEHIIRDSDARLMVCHSDLVGRLTAETDLSNLRTVVVVGGASRSEAGVTQVGEEALITDEVDFPEPVPQIEPWDVHSIIYTSGTTGPSKGVQCTHVHTLVHTLATLEFFGPEDRFLMNLLYIHMAGPLVTVATLAAGASMVILREFKTSTFWETVRRTGSTCAFLMGSMSTFLLNQPPREDDADHPLKAVWQQPLASDHVAFARRFGVTLYTQVDMTEAAGAIFSGPVPSDRVMPLGYVGRLQPGWPGYQARLVDEHDREVPVGEVGELVLRCDTPWVITPGYYRRPDATASAWRNGWFHTGDALRQDADGTYFFVDRTKDSIRRRGENISSAELEAEVFKYGAVADVAAIAVKNELDDEEVLIAVVPKDGAVIDPLELTHFLIPRVPHYMVPRFVRVMDQLPYSDTNKIQKAKLREYGIGIGVWDREAAGIVVKRESIGGTKGRA
jgi:crotonobetaine/carnitine-CoA ligase